MRFSVVKWLALVGGLYLAGLSMAFAVEKNLLIVETTVEETPSPQISLSWDEQVDGATVEIYRRLLGEEGIDSWGEALATVDHPTTTWTDTDISVGTIYEYRLLRPYTSASAQQGSAYVCAGIKAPLVEDRGKILLIVDETIADELTTELARLELDLTGDGYTVIRSNFARDTSEVYDEQALRSYIQNQYNADPTKVKMVFLFGHLPVAMSGNVAPDGHNHEPHVADTYFADIDGEWQDVLDYDGYEAGDGVYDKGNLTAGNIELQLGRVDLSGMSAWPQTEIELLRNYLRKDHAWRHKQVVTPFRASWSSGHLWSERSNLYAMFGEENVTLEGFIPEVEENVYTWGIDFSDWNGSNYSEYDFKCTFSINFGSHKQKWNRGNNAMRAMLCMPDYVLTCAWGGRPAWAIHHMGMGKPIGYSAYRTMNSGDLDYAAGNYSFLAGGVWVNLMGDPSLRLHVVEPVSDLNAQVSGNEVSLDWSAPSDSGVTGYHVYRSTDRLGPYTRVNGSILNSSNYTDTPGGLGEVWYQVRGVKLEETVSGSYYNASQGVFAAVDLSSGDGNQAPQANDQTVATNDGVPIDVTLLATDPDDDSLSYSITTIPQHGKITGTPPYVTYTPEYNYEGTDHFEFTAWDGMSDDTGRVTITVTDINHAPAAENQETIVPADSLTTFPVSTSDPDGDSLNFVIASQASNGTATGGAYLSYQSNAGYSGPDSFVWNVNDGELDSAQQMMNLLVLPLTQLASDDFEDGNMDGWNVESGEATGWIVNDANELVYETNDSDNILSWQDGGTRNWENLAIRMKVKSSDDDELGVLFNYLDTDNYLGFVMRSQNNYRRIIQKSAGTQTTLQEDAWSYVKDREYLLEIFCTQNQIIVQIDRQVVMREIVGSGVLGTGMLALYSHQNDESIFDDIEILEIGASPTYMPDNQSCTVNTPGDFFIGTWDYTLEQWLSSFEGDYSNNVFHYLIPKNHWLCMAIEDRSSAFAWTEGVFMMKQVWAAGETAPDEVGIYPAALASSSGPLQAPATEARLPENMSFTVASNHNILFNAWNYTTGDWVETNESFIGSTTREIPVDANNWYVLTLYDETTGQWISGMYLFKQVWQ
ncbi:MAG: Ig-like domain-containing protein [Candidatus Sumerlaeia bacterium]